MEKKITVIVPAYNEEVLIESSYRKLKNSFEAHDYLYELIFIDDGSVDKTREILERIEEDDPLVKVISFSRNFGHQMAIVAGMDASTGDAIVTIDADLQDPVEVIFEMINKWEEGYDIVYGKRRKREGETIFKKITAKVYYRFLNYLTDIDLPVDVADFRLIDRHVNEVLKKMKERHVYMRGLVAWVGFSQCHVMYNRNQRMAGETKYSFSKMLKLAMDGIVAFSSKLLKSGMFISAFILLFVFALAVLYVFNIKLSEYLLDMIKILFMAVLFGYLGLIGVYLSNMHEELLERPKYIVRKKKKND